MLQCYVLKRIIYEGQILPILNYTSMIMKMKYYLFKINGKVFSQVHTPRVHAP